MNENKKTDTDLFAESNVIYSYTRVDMIRDGHLIEVPQETSEEMGFLFPVGILSEVWDLCVAWTDDDSERQVYQEEQARLGDVLYMFWRAAQTVPTSIVFFEVACVPRDGKAKESVDVKLKGVVGPGDDGRPVLTIMLPEQD